MSIKVICGLCEWPMQCTAVKAMVTRTYMHNEKTSMRVLQYRCDTCSNIVDVPEK